MAVRLFKSRKWSWARWLARCLTLSITVASISSPLLTYLLSDVKYCLSADREFCVKPIRDELRRRGWFYILAAKASSNKELFQNGVLKQLSDTPRAKWVCRTNGLDKATAFRDSADICFLDNVSKNEAARGAPHLTPSSDPRAVPMKTGPRLWEKTMPLVAHLFRERMGALDLFDQLDKTYSVRIRSSTAHQRYLSSWQRILERNAYVIARHPGAASPPAVLPFLFVAFLQGRARCSEKDFLHEAAVFIGRFAMLGRAIRSDDVLKKKRQQGGFRHFPYHHETVQMPLRAEGKDGARRATASGPCVVCGGSVLSGSPLDSALRAIDLPLFAMQCLAAPQARVLDRLGQATRPSPRPYLYVNFLFLLISPLQDAYGHVLASAGCAHLALPRPQFGFCV